MKYQFVKKRQDISTEQINSLRDFDAVLAGSKQVSTLSYSVKLLLGLAVVPIAAIVYFLSAGPSPAKVEQPATVQTPSTEESVAAATTEQEQPKPVAGDKPETPAQQPTTRPKAAATVERKETSPADPKPEGVSEVKKEDVYLNAEPKEGFELFYAFVESELTYPELARKDSVQGYVKVMFSIDVDGALKDVTIVESLGELFDNEAIRVIKRSPPWNPATFNGYPVSSRMSIKLTFKIE